MIDYEYVLKEFKKYVEKFEIKNEEIAMKISHSYHVADLMQKLAKGLELTEEKIKIAKTIGILHDIGRFLQYEKTELYNDIKSKLDHAELADTYLFLEKHIKDFKIPLKDISLIRTALRNHNKLIIENGLPKEEQFFAKLIRDADKTDIFRQSASIYEFSYKKSPTQEAKEQFFKHELVKFEYVNNESDRVLSNLSYIFDINFKESYKLLYETDNLELFLSVVEVGIGYEKEFENIKKEVRTYLEERIKDEYAR